MKKALFLLFFIAPFLSKASCITRYVYDLAGNRIMRYQDCSDGNNDPGDGTGPIEPPTDPTGFDPHRHSNSNADTTLNGLDDAFIATMLPNPTKGQTFFTFSNNLTNAPIVIMDSKGKIVQKAIINGSSYIIDLSAYASGEYFITINVANHTYSFKLTRI